MTFTIGTPYTRNAGYYRNDDTPSGGKRTEADIRTCPHCQAIIKLQEWSTVQGGRMGGGWCSKCFAPICQSCGTKMQTEGCIPFIRKIEAACGMTSKYKQVLRDSGLDTPAAPSRIFTGITTTGD